MARAPLTSPVDVDELAGVEGLYLFHLEPRYQHAGHRLGWSTDLRARIRQHLDAGRRSSPLIRAQLAAGGTVTVARVWVGGDRTLEARLKRQHGLASHCPICRATRKDDA